MKDYQSIKLLKNLKVSIINNLIQKILILQMKNLKTLNRHQNNKWNLKMLMINIMLDLGIKIINYQSNYSEL